MTSGPISPIARRWPWVAAVVGLAVLFGLHAALASRNKSSTWDEPMHMMSSWLITHRGDFRANPEHPSLWKYVAGLGLIGQSLPIDENHPKALALFRQLEQQWYWMNSSIYTTPEVSLHTERMVGRARVAMALFTVALGLVVARWSWRWGGPMAALIAVGLLSLDPNLLAHGALVTNDVASCVWFALAAYLTWSLGTRFRWSTAIGLALACAAGITTKFTCLLLAPMIAVPLLYRLFDRAAWPAGKNDVPAPLARRLSLLAGAGAVTVLTCWLLLWPLYQFRTTPIADGPRFADQYARSLYGYNKALGAQYHDPTLPRRSDAELARDASNVPVDLASRFFFFVTEKGLVPQAWGFGLNYANARSFVRASYLMGDVSEVGFRSYFPLALAFKTPLAAIAIVLVCGVAGAVQVSRRWREPGVRWMAVCLVVPPLIYFGVACMSSLNIGVRHVLPVLAPAYVGAGVVMARALRRWKPARTLVPVALAALAVETLSAFPNYLPFFNVAVGGSQGGLGLLADSNLDWGQDLPAVAAWAKEWHAEHPGEPFYLSYFGNCPPSAYGIEFINAVPGTDADPRKPVDDLNGGVYAVSATHLQAVYSPAYETAMARLRRSQPLAVLNGSIYIYAMRAVPRPTTAVATSTQPSTQPSTEPSPQPSRP